MRRGSTFRDKPCGYCGSITLKSTPDHILPKNMYTGTVPANFNRATIPACPPCQSMFSRIEARFRDALVVAGETMTPEREELWRTAVRSFERQPGGEGDFFALFNMLVPVPGTEDERGRPRHKIYPAADERVMRVVKKTVRGLCHSRDWHDVISEERVVAGHKCIEIPPQFEADLQTVYEVPEVFVSRAYFFGDGAHSDEMHSIWLLKFFAEVEFFAVVLAGPR